MDSLTQKILENAKRRREKANQNFVEKENVETSKVESLVKKFETNSITAITSNSNDKNIDSEKSPKIFKKSEFLPKPEIAIQNKIDIEQKIEYPKISDENLNNTKKVELIRSSTRVSESNRNYSEEIELPQSLKTDNESSEEIKKNDIKQDGNNVSSNHSSSMIDNSKEMLLILEEENKKTPKNPRIKDEKLTPKVPEQPTFSYPSTPNTPRVVILNENEDKKVESVDLKRKTLIDDVKMSKGEFESRTSTITSTSSIKTIKSSSSDILSQKLCLLHDKAHLNDVYSEIKRNLGEIQSIIHQTGQALNIAYAQNKKNTQLSKEIIEAERLILLHSQKRNYLREFEENLSAKGFSCVCPSKNTFNYFVNINLKDFCLMIKNDYFQSFSNELEIYYFCFVVSHHHNFFTTNVVNINDVDKNVLKFNGSFKFPEVDASENIRIQLFVLTQQEKPRNSTFKLGKFDLTPKRNSKIAKKSYANIAASSETMACNKSTNFVYVGEVNLAVESNGIQRLSFSNIVYDCPITGNLNCFAESRIIESYLAQGFLTLYIYNSGQISWQRLWCGLMKDYLNCWDHPLDPLTKPPLKKIKMKWSDSTEFIRTLPIEECSRPNTFEIKLMEPNPSQLKGFMDVKYIFAADSMEQRTQWIENFIIHNKRFQKLKI